MFTKHLPSSYQTGPRNKDIKVLHMPLKHFMNKRHFRHSFKLKSRILTIIVRKDKFISYRYSSILHRALKINLAIHFAFCKLWSFLTTAFTSRLYNFEYCGVHFNSLDKSIYHYCTLNAKTILSATGLKHLHSVVGLLTLKGITSRVKVV